ncbi:hypothetical protein PVAND_014681 [Polypedilum vanderplanki]|uniref:Uncharacterized protein n=1 Tax=Polypedilum vanderplanki TaxID=319348 RepID=A0A9J6BAD9_POLVA|nr:hypothetical protein PVAND_014681 [Polypedilum vanderplanki]
MNFRSKFLFHCAIIINFTSVSTFTIKCNYTESTLLGLNLDDNDYYYTCHFDTTKIYPENRVSIEKIEGKHQFSRVDNDVEQISFLNASFKLFPKNIDKIYHKIIIISIFRSKLEEIDCEDVKVFSKLKILYIFDSKIEVLRENLFSFNPDIEIVYMVKNKIRHIDPKIFIGLENLKGLYFRENFCKIGDVNTRAKALKMANRIGKSVCKSKEFERKTDKNFKIFTKTTVMTTTTTAFDLTTSFRFKSLTINMNSSEGKISLFGYLRIWLLVISLSLLHLVKFLLTFWIPKKLKDVRGQLVLITGGSQGIGRALAFKFAEVGCNVAIASRNLEIGSKTAAEISEKYKNIKVKAFRCDVSKVEEVKRLHKEIKITLGTVDILINNAGLLGLENSLLEGNDEAYQNIIDVNLTSYIWTARAFLPDMIKQKRGHIVGISSTQFLDTCPNAVTYCTTKYGNAGFIAALREEMCFYGYDDFIKTTSVHPSFVQTNDGLSDLYNNLMYDKFVQMNDPDYMANLILKGILRDEFSFYVPFHDFILYYLSKTMPRKVKTRTLYEIMRKDKRDEYIRLRREKCGL